jgi:hypothetical protein
VKPTVNLRGATKTHGREHALRFVFGGIVTAGVGLIAHHWGPIVGGLFLGFPSIFPASITLVKEHDGRAKAIDDARGARLGSLGLMAFGFVVWSTARSWAPSVVLGVATAAWLAVDLAAWTLVYGMRHRHG